MNTNNIVCLNHTYPPDVTVTPVAIRASKIFRYVTDDWGISVVNGFAVERLPKDVDLHTVKTPYPHGMVRLLRRAKMDKLVDWFEWPDDAVYWNLPALMKARALIKAQKPKAIVVFMMPYSSGIAGVFLKWMTNLPLVLNLDDSPTCTDMHPYFASRLHYWLARGLEDFYVRHCDAIIYNSQKNLEWVRDRQPKSQHAKFHLVRFGVDTADYEAPIAPPAPNGFQVVYIGGMSGWNQFSDGPRPSRAKRLYQAWMRFGRHHLVQLDQRGSSPFFIGKAIQEVVENNPEWADQIRLDIFGNKYPKETIDRALSNSGIGSVVKVYGAMANVEAIQIARQADLLFMALPKRTDDSPGGRISAKTFEYLMTDRPILAAIPKGENWDYLADKPGVWLVAPDDTAGMAKALSEIAAAKFSGKPMSFDRSRWHYDLSYLARAREFASVLQCVIPVDAAEQSIARSVNTFRPGQSDVLGEGNGDH